MQVTGTAVASSVGIASLGSRSTHAQPSNQWATADSPTGETLTGVVDTTEGPFAVGGGGDVIARTDSGWETVVDYGPQARSRRLTGVDVTTDGTRIWFVGSSGVIGEYDVTTETLTNYSAPMEMTSTWEDVAVTGEAGTNEHVYFVNGSGEELSGVRQDTSAMQYDDIQKPGGGSTIPAIDFYALEAGHVCSTSQFVAVTQDGSDSWEQVGIDFASQNFSDLASVGEQDVNVAAGNGIIYRFDGFRWTPHVIDDGRQTIRAIDREQQEGLAAGNAGRVYERQSAGQWQPFNTPTEATLRGASWGPNGIDVAVGDSGTIVERVTGSDEGTTSESTANSGASNTADVSTASVAGESKTVENYVEGEWVGS